MEMKFQNTTLNNYQGIDVSNHQGQIDWSLVSKDVIRLYKSDGGRSGGQLLDRGEHETTII